MESFLPWNGKLLNVKFSATQSRMKHDFRWTKLQMKFNLLKGLIIDYMYFHFRCYSRFTKSKKNCRLWITIFVTCVKYVFDISLPCVVVVSNRLIFVWFQNIHFNYYYRVFWHNETANPKTSKTLLNVGISASNGGKAVFQKFSIDFTDFTLWMKSMRFGEKTENQKYEKRKNNSKKKNLENSLNPNKYCLSI